MKRAQVVDFESRASRDDHQSLRLWLRFLACTNLIERRVRKNLRAGFATTLPRFDFLAQLERHPMGLKMGEISERMMVTGGNVTGIADELVAAGMVVREPSRDDRRAYTVKMTAAGRRSFAEMARAHERWIVELLAGLNAREKASVFEALAKLKRHAATSNGDGAA
jgi:DNA-binding MarR family transcriptional regulator